ncbi:hypothetical protein ACHQM5_010417 [Ranunculus cassubicifolius]
MTPKEHIETIRKTKFSIGGEPNLLTEDLHQAVKNLSGELYAKDVHFLMEIIQNAEDNAYSEGVKPSLEFIVTSRDITGTGASSTLLVFNNEKGFSAKNIESICSVGRSTKKGQRQNGYIGEKGIGFKSVFLITAHPYIFSNGYQIRFSEDPCPHCNLGYIVPEWVEENPTLAAIQKIYGSAKNLPTTTIILPLKLDKENDVKLQLSSIHPELLLFLSKIRQLSVREDKEGSILNTVSAISISSEIDFVTRKNVAAESYTLHLSAEEDREDGERECSYYMWRHKFPVNQANKVDRRMEINNLVITLAFPNGKRLNRGKHSPGIYAFLPTETVTNFPFIIQADFVLASSRENILWDNKWNLGILDCVPSAFVNAFISLVKTSETAPVSCLPRMFEFLPVESSSHPKLNNVRDKIKQQLLNETVMPSESQTAQKFFYKPCDVGRIMPAFWDILVKARAEGVSLHNLSSHGKYVLNSAFDKEHYDEILNFLEVKSMENEWYAKCIQCSDLVLGLSEKVYVELLFFTADKWRSHFHNTNMGNIPLLKYVGQDSNVHLCSMTDALKWGGKKLYMSSDSRHISWLIDWNKEFGCVAGFFFPKSTQESMMSFHNKTVTAWLSGTVNASYTTVNDYAVHIMDSLNSDKRLVLAFTHFLCQSLQKYYLSGQELESLCKKMPLLDNYGKVIARKGSVLVPARGSKWVGLIGSNPWRTNYIELGEEYLRAGNYAGVYTSVTELTKFLKDHIGASDIPEICPPDDTFAAVSSPLTKSNVLLLLEWIQNLKHRRKPADGNFLRCIKEGSWLRTRVGSSVSYRPPCQSFLSNSSWGDLLNNGSVLVDIPLIDQQFYGNIITQYKEELKTLGVMSDFGEACKFIGEHLMSLAVNGNLTKENVFSVLKFIRFLREKCLPPAEFIKSVKEGSWLRTSHGVRAPVGSILYDSEWASAAKFSSLPFVDQEYYGKEIMNFRDELQLLGVVIGFDKDYQRLADCFKVPTSFTSLSVNDVVLIFQCIRHSRSSDKVVSLLKDKRWLKTTLGYRSPTECFLSDSEWGCLFQVFGDFPVINEKSYGYSVYSYRNELKKLGVVVDFQDASKAFACQFKKLVSAHSITKEHGLSFLRCYRDLKKTPHRLPSDLHDCIYDEEWLKTRLGLRCPKDAILFSSDWEHISPIALLPFIDDSEKGYGAAIREYEKELKEIGVTVKFNKGSKFVASGLCIPQNPADIIPSSVLSLLECVRNIIKEQIDPSKEFLARISKHWVKTYMGYRAPNECLLFSTEWSSLLKREDAAFVDEKFYGSDLSSYQKELNAIGVIVDVRSGCQLLASQLESHSKFDVIARIYTYLDKFDWKPKDGEAKRIWIPNGSDNGEWVNPEECVVYDKDGLFSLRLNVLEMHYDKKLLAFFSMSLNVRHNPSVDDYCRLWKSWEDSGLELTPAECCAFWVCVGKHWNSKTTKGLLAEMMKLPVNRDADVIQLVNKQDVFIPDDLLLVDLFEKSFPDPIFVWYPQRSLISIPRTKLNDIYRSTGVRPISESVKKNESSEPDSRFKPVDPKEVLIKRELMILVLGFLSDPCVDMDANKRQALVKTLLDVNVFETDEPVSVTYTLSMSSGKTVNVKAKQMIRWERECSKMFFQKIERSSGHVASIEFATSFGQVIAEGLLWEKEDRIAELSELIKLGWLLEFEKEAIGFLMKSKNLQLYLEDVEFLKATFSTE